MLSMHRDGMVLTIYIGRQKVMYALTKIKGVGRRYSNLVCKKADGMLVPMNL